MELIKLYTALWRRRWLVLESVVFFTAVGVALALLLPRNYTATARVLVSSNDTAMSILSELGLSEVATGLAKSDDDILSKISLATTRPVLNEVIWRLQLRDSDGKLLTPDKFLVPGLTGDLLAQPNISVSQEQGSAILVFKGKAGDPELARLIADTVVKVATQQSQDRARADTRSAREFIEQQLEVVRNEFDQAMANIAKAQEAEKIIDLNSEIESAIARVSQLMLAYEDNLAAIRETRAKIAQLKAYQAKEGVGAVSAATANINSEVESLQQRLLELQAQRDRYLTDETEKHPDVQKIDQLIAATKDELAKALEAQHELDPSLQALEAQLAGEIEKGRSLDETIRRTTDEFAAYPEKMRHISELQLASNAAENVFKSLQEQRYQVGVAEAMLVSDLQMVEPAKAPDRPSSPKLLVNAVAGFAFGCMFGFGLAILFEYIDDTVKTSEDLAEIWDVMRLGIVPRYKLTGDRRVIDEIAATHPVSEAYRTVRNGLLYASLDKPLHLIAVSSAAPSEGKSTFTVNLAVSFAREGKRVLIVDCDLRRPTQHRNFPATSNHVGLTDVLTGMVEASDAVQGTSVEGLYLLSSGPTPTDPARLVESLRLRQMLLDLRKQFDVVVVDTPPVLAVNDAMVIARAVDGMVLVVESGRTTRKMLSDLRERFESSGIEPLGVVLNKMDYYASGYGSYYRVYRQYYKGDGTPARRRKHRKGGAA